ncbi:MAG: hypothetical protein Q9M92_08365 [Enterobacterales bacterium]|nr:hypothetical protein [Enterobacterales bacterium]
MDDLIFELSSSRIEEIQSLWQQILLLPTEPINVNRKIIQSTSDTGIDALSNYSVKLYFKARENPLLAKVIHIRKEQSEATKIVFPELGQQLIIQSFYFKRLGPGAE